MAKKGFCKWKLRYPTINQAQMEIDRAATYRGETLRAYLCDKCENYHLTSMSKATFKRWVKHPGGAP